MAQGRTGSINRVSKSTLGSMILHPGKEPHESSKELHEIAPSKFRAETCVGGPNIRMAVSLIQTREPASGLLAVERDSW